MSTDSSATTPNPFDNEPEGKLAVIASSARAPYPLRLSIWHLMVWTATSAAMMAFYNLEMSLYPESISQSIADWMKSPVSIVLRTTWAMPAGAAMGGVLMFVARRRRRQAFPKQPGEWLLVTLGIRELLALIVYLPLIVPLTQKNVSWPNYFLVSSIASLELLDVVVFLLPALMCKDRRSWRWFFWIASIVAFLSAGINIILLFLPGASFPYTHTWLLHWIPLGLCALILAIAVITDLRRRSERGWVHWVGIATLVLLVLNQEGWYIYGTFFFST